MALVILTYMNGLQKSRDSNNFTFVQTVTCNSLIETCPDDADHNIFVLSKSWSDFCDLWRLVMTCSDVLICIVTSSDL